MMAGLICVSLGSAARSDTVHDGRGTFGDVEITGFNDDLLVFRMTDGRLLSRKAVDVRYVNISNPREPMAEVISEAERLRDAKQYVEAIPRYEQVQKSARVVWMI